MKQTYDDIDLCLCFVRHCIKNTNGLRATHLSTALRVEISELTQILGALDPNTYCYTRGLIHTFRLAVLVRCHILEWLFMLAQASTEEKEQPFVSLDDSEAGLLPEALLPTTESDAEYMFLSHAKTLLSQLFALFQDFPNFIKLPPVFTNNMQRPVMLLWRKLMDLIDSNRAADQTRNKPDAKVSPFWKMFNEALMDLKALPTISATPPANHESAAHVWEFKWDLLFHLIPLLQFDRTGVLLGIQQVAQHANWQLVLDLLKKAPANIFSTSPDGLEHIRVLELSQVWTPSIEVIPQLWAVVRESYKGSAPTPSSSSLDSLKPSSWSAFLANFDPSTPSTTLTLAPASAWSKDKDYDLFLRILFVHIYKTGLPFTLPPSPLLPPPPQPTTGQSPRAQPFPSPPRPTSNSYNPSASPQPTRSVSRVDGNGYHLPLGRTFAPPSSFSSSSSSPLPDVSFSFYPLVPPSALYLPESAMSKFYSAIYQSSWVKKLLPPTDILCLEMLLNVHKDKRSYISLLKEKIKELVGHNHFLKAQALLQLALFGQVFSMDLSVVAIELHDSMKFMWVKYINARKDAAQSPNHDSSPKLPNKPKRFRPSPEEEKRQKRQEETRHNAQLACEEMEPHWELALRMLTRVFTNARGDFSCREYKLIPDHFESWLRCMFFEIRHMPPKLAMAAINLVSQTLPRWSVHRSGASGSAFECSLTLHSYYRTLRAPHSSPSSYSSPSSSSTASFASPSSISSRPSIALLRPSAQLSPITASRPKPATPYNPFTTSQSSPSSPSVQSSFALASPSASQLPSQPPPPPPPPPFHSLQLEASPLAGQPPPTADGDWDDLCAALDLDAIVRQAEEAKLEEQRKREEEDEAVKRMEEARRKEEADNNARLAREKEILNERSHMELLARHLKNVMDAVKRAILYDMNTHTMRTSLVSLLVKLAPLYIGLYRPQALTWKGVFELFGFVEPAGDSKSWIKPSAGFPIIPAAERRRLGIQFLAEAFSDLPSLPPYYLQAYVGPLFQEHGPQIVRIWLGGAMESEWTKQHALTASFVRCSHQLPFFKDLAFKEEYKVNKESCFADRHLLVARVMKNTGALWEEWSGDEEIAGTYHKLQQLRKDFQETIVGGFLNHVDQYFASMNEDLCRKEGGRNEPYHSNRARQIYKMLGSLIRYGEGLIYQPSQERGETGLVFALCDKYFQTQDRMTAQNLCNTAREIMRRSKYEIYSDVVHFLKTFDWSRSTVPERLQRFLYDVLDESMRTGFTRALEPTPDTSKVEASLRIRIASLLVKDPPTLRHHIEATFISDALTSDRIAVDISRSSSLTGFISAYRKAVLLQVFAIFRHLGAVNREALMQDAVILALPLLRCLDTPCFDPGFTYQDGPASRLSCYDVFNQIAAALKAEQIGDACNTAPSSSDTAALSETRTSSLAHQPFLKSLLRCVLLHAILDLNAAEAASRFQRVAPTLPAVQRELGAETKRAEDLYLQTTARRQERAVLRRSAEASNLMMATRSSYDLSVASDRDKMLALMVNRVVETAIATLAALPFEPEAHTTTTGCLDALQTVLDRMGRPEGLAGRVAKRREAVVNALLTQTPLLLRHLQQHRERTLLDCSGQE